MLEARRKASFERSLEEMGLPAEFRITTFEAGIDWDRENDGDIALGDFTVEEGLEDHSDPDSGDDDYDYDIAAPDLEVDPGAD